MSHSEEWGQLIEQFVDHALAVKGLTPATCESYRFALRPWLAFVQERCAPGQVDLQVLEAYVASLRQAGLGDGTICQRVTTLRCLLRYGERRRIVPIGLSEDLVQPKEARLLPRAVDQGAITRLLAAPDPRRLYYLRDKAILELLYGTGLRRAECAGLTLADVSADTSGDGWLRVMGKGRKERIAPVPALALFQHEQPKEIVARVRFLLSSIGLGYAKLEKELQQGSQALTRPEQWIHAKNILGNSN